MTFAFKVLIFFIWIMRNMNLTSFVKFFFSIKVKFSLNLIVCNFFLPLPSNFPSYFFRWGLSWLHTRSFICWHDYIVHVITLLGNNLLKLSSCFTGVCTQFGRRPIISRLYEILSDLSKNESNSQSTYTYTHLCTFPFFNYFQCHFIDMFFAQLYEMPLPVWVSQTFALFLLLCAITQKQIPQNFCVCVWGRLYFSFSPWHQFLWWSRFCLFGCFIFGLGRPLLFRLPSSSCPSHPFPLCDGIFDFSTFSPVLPHSANVFTYNQLLKNAHALACPHTAVPYTLIQSVLRTF